MLDNSEFVRYSRQIAIPEIGEIGQSHLKEKRVLVVGCGGLGNLVSQYMVTAGVGHVVISDHDTVDISNLNRQLAYTENDIDKYKSAVLKNRLIQQNHLTRVTQIQEKLLGTRLKLEVMMSDLVLDCSDNFETRYELNSACWANNKSYVSGAVADWRGQVASFGNNIDSACYQCLYPNKVLNNSENNCSTMGAIGPIVGVIASMQSLVALKVLAGIEFHKGSRLLVFEGMSMQWRSLKIGKDSECKVCKSTGEANENTSRS